MDFRAKSKFDLATFFGEGSQNFNILELHLRHHAGGLLTNVHGTSVVRYLHFLKN